MKKITFLAALFVGAASFAQVAYTSFEEEPIVMGTNSDKYFDTGDASVAHDLVNNPMQTPVDQNGAIELGVNARYEPYDTPDVGLTDGDFVGVTTFQPSAELGFTDGVQGYQVSDADGNFIMDGTLNESGSDRLRIYVKDITNATEIDLFNSTGMDLDDLVPFDAGTMEYQLEWQTVTAALPTDATVQLVIESRMNAGGEVFYFDNIEFSGSLGVNDVNDSAFTLYPNPATQGFVNITSKLAGDKNIAIYDVLGKQVINTTIAGDRLQISELNSGLYIVKITQAGATTTKKLIIK